MRSITIQLPFWLFPCLLLVLTDWTAAADPFPAQALPGTDIAGNLPAGYEPSGAVWHPNTSQLFTVSDEGLVSRMNADGSGVTNWSVAGDLEGVSSRHWIF